MNNIYNSHVRTCWCKYNYLLIKECCIDWWLACNIRCCRFPASPTTIILVPELFWLPTNRKQVEIYRNYPLVWGSTRVLFHIIHSFIITNQWLLGNLFTRKPCSLHDRVLSSNTKLTPPLNFLTLLKSQLQELWCPFRHPAAASWSLKAPMRFATWIRRRELGGWSADGDGFEITCYQLGLWAENYWAHFPSLPFKLDFGAYQNNHFLCYSLQRFIAERSIAFCSQ